MTDDASHDQAHTVTTCRATADNLDRSLLGAILGSWDRSNRVLVNLLGAMPEGALEIRPTESSPTIGQLFNHIHYVRLVFLLENAPELAPMVPETDWGDESDRSRLVQMLNESAAAVRDAVRSRLEGGREMDLHYDHPILLLQHMLWHEGYHHGQMKLALKLAGRPISDDVAGPLTWSVFIRKTSTRADVT